MSFCLAGAPLPPVLGTRPRAAGGRAPFSGTVMPVVWGDGVASIHSVIAGPVGYCESCCYKRGYKHLFKSLLPALLGDRPAVGLLTTCWFHVWGAAVLVSTAAPVCSGTSERPRSSESLPTLVFSVLFVARAILTGVRRSAHCGRDRRVPDDRPCGASLRVLAGPSAFPLEKRLVGSRSRLNRAGVCCREQPLTSPGC